MAASHLSLLSLSSIFKPKPPYLVAARRSSSSPHASVLAFSPTQPSMTRLYKLNLQTSVRSKTIKTWKISAINDTFFLSDANTVEVPEEVVSTTDDGVSTIISALLFFAFIGLSILTIGVIYIAVTDFLQKREGDKFVKEEAAKKKKSGKKGKVRTRAGAGPRGFGQKIKEDDDVDLAD